MKTRFTAMAAELKRSGALYLPSSFWNQLNAVNESQLAKDGFENFKRTVNQNYFNWGPNSTDDNQLRNLSKLLAANPIGQSAGPVLEGDPRLINMFNQNMLDSPEKARIYVDFVGLLWRFASQEDPDRLTDRLSEPSLGNPIRIRLGGRLISQDLANSIRERNIVCMFAPASANARQVIAEIGAGYGRLGYAFIAASDCKYLVFDVPPALYISERYLSEVFPDKRVFRFRQFDRFASIEKELESADIGFFTGNQIELFPQEYFDVAISVSALHEMRSEQIANYLARMQFLTKGAIYLKNWRSWHNTADDVRINEDTFRLSDPWRAALERIDPVQDMFAEKIFVRRQ